MSGVEKRDDVAPLAAPDVAALADRLEALAKKVRLDDTSYNWMKLSACANENIDTILAALRSAPDGWTAGFAAGIEAAAQECEPLGDPPCDCAYETTCNGEPCWIYDCHCSNSGDLTRIASWCSDKSRAAAIRALPTPPAKASRDEGGGDE